MYNQYPYQFKMVPKNPAMGQPYVATIHAVSLGQAHTIIKQQYQLWHATQVK